MRCRMAEEPKKRRRKPPRFADKQELNRIMDEVNERMGFVPDPDATPEKVQEMMLAEGVVPEDNEFSREIMRMRYGYLEVSFSELSFANRRRCERDFHRKIDDWSPSDWAVAVAGEVGEACNLVQKLRRGEEVDPQAIADELADAVMNADLLCQRLGLDLGETVRRKFNEISERVGSRIKL
jgi:NTP pyrophosphatase (non-canonical NTP hydrolase)